MNRNDCIALDAQDPLRALRDQFELPPGIVYLDGNSLGVLPKAAMARLRTVVEDEWGRELIKSWNTAGWITLPQRVGDKIAPPGRRGPGRARGGGLHLRQPLQGAERRAGHRTRRRARAPAHRVRAHRTFRPISTSPTAWRASGARSSCWWMPTTWPQRSTSAPPC